MAMNSKLKRQIQEEARRAVARELRRRARSRRAPEHQTDRDTIPAPPPLPREAEGIPEDRGDTEPDLLSPNLWDTETPLETPTPPEEELGWDPSSVTVS